MPAAKLPAKASRKDIKEKWLEQAGKLFDKNATRFFTVLDESESKKVNVACTLQIDQSENATSIKTKLRFSEVHTDELTHSFDDPRQLKLPGAGEEGDKRSRGKAGEAEEEAKD